MGIVAAASVADKRRATTRIKVQKECEHVKVEKKSAQHKVTTKWMHWEWASVALLTASSLGRKLIRPFSSKLIKFYMFLFQIVTILSVCVALLAIYGRDRCDEGDHI